MGLVRRSGRRYLGVKFLETALGSWESVLQWVGENKGAHALLRASWRMGSGEVMV